MVSVYLSLLASWCWTRAAGVVNVPDFGNLAYCVVARDRYVVCALIFRSDIMDLKWGVTTLHVTLNWWLPDAFLHVWLS